MDIGSRLSLCDHGLYCMLSLLLSLFGTELTKKYNYGFPLTSMLCFKSVVLKTTQPIKVA